MKSPGHQERHLKIVQGHHHSPVVKQVDGMHQLNLIPFLVLLDKMRQAMNPNKRRLPCQDHKEKLKALVSTGRTGIKS